MSHFFMGMLDFLTGQFPGVLFKQCWQALNTASAPFGQFQFKALINQQTKSGLKHIGLQPCSK